ncbi:SOS response-associated peptidase family protein [Pseudomonas sp. R1-18]|uniref:SOS response-associated peptidase family protein n=1 Tax=Pseudomonas sp. R1-18 TaxID=1632772 RepID=UPI003DA82FF5
MCELIAQFNSAQSYLASLGRPLMPLNFPNEEFSTNATRQMDENFIPDLHNRNHIIRPNHPLTAVMNLQGELQTRQIRWGWSPIWSMGTRPPLTHLPLEIVMRSKVFTRMRNSGRALVAVDGWFDAAVDHAATGRNRFTYMRPRSKQPMFLAALAQISEPPSGCNGLVLVTQGGGGAAGPLQLLAFTGESAIHWLDPELDWQQARELASLDLVNGGHLEQVLVTQRCVVKGR